MFPETAAEQDRLARTLRRLVLQAGAETLCRFRRTDRHDAVKPDGSPVSDADLAANRVIVAGLAAAWPGVPTVAEEGGGIAPSDWEAPFFLVDPLDGTKEYIRGGEDFTVNIALVVARRPVMGAVFAPASGLLFWTPRPGVAIEETGGDPERIGSLSPLTCRKADPAALSVLLSRSHCDRATLDYAARYAPADTRHLGSSLKFCLIARGEADLHPRFGPTMEWDTAAGHAVLAAAGGRVTALDTDRPLLYGKPGLRNPFFVASGPGIGISPLAGRP